LVSAFVNPNFYYLNHLSYGWPFGALVDVLSGPRQNLLLQQWLHGENGLKAESCGSSSNKKITYAAWRTGAKKYTHPKASGATGKKILDQLQTGRLASRWMNTL